MTTQETTEEKTYTDGMGNTYRCVKTIDSTSWHAIGAMFKELFDRHYGNYEPQVLSTTSCHELDGTVTHNFGGLRNLGPKVVIGTNGTTEFYELVGEPYTIFDRMRDEKERGELTEKLLGGMSLEELRRAKVTIE